MKVFNFIDKCNAVVGMLVTALTAILGTYWYVFVSYLALNVVDWVTGTWNARKKGESSSESGREGAKRKVGNWVIIGVAFLTADVLVKLAGDMLGLNVSFLIGIGWLVTCMLWINEVRSILENLVEMGYNVPEFLIKGLEVANKLVNDKVSIGGEDDE